MSAGDPPWGWAAQSGFDVRLCWGPAGLQALGPGVGVIVLVDILRFTTALEVADGAGPRGLSLSPGTLTALRAGDRIVLPSANGAHCSALAATLAVTVVGGSLRNAGAVAAWLLAGRGRESRQPIAVVPCGERWPDDTLRPAVEDLIGAGAIVDALGEGDPALSLSPEARSAGAAFRGALHDLPAALAESGSGRQLRSAGKGEDIEWAAALNVSRGIPVLGAEGAFGDGGKGGGASG